MFYKIENGELMSSAHVEGEGFMLDAANKDDHTYPVSGWTWFETEGEARVALGVTI